MGVGDGHPARLCAIFWPPAKIGKSGHLVRIEAGRIAREAGQHRVRDGHITLVRYLHLGRTPSQSVGKHPLPAQLTHSVSRAARGSWQVQIMLAQAALGR